MNDQFFLLDYIVATARPCIRKKTSVLRSVLRLRWSVQHTGATKRDRCVSFAHRFPRASLKIAEKNAGLFLGCAVLRKGSYTSWDCHGSLVPAATDSCYYFKSRFREQAAESRRRVQKLKATCVSRRPGENENETRRSSTYPPATFGVNNWSPPTHEGPNN